MPTQQSINSFVKGMNKDLDISVLQKDMYLDAKNFRVVTTEGSTTTALEVVDGTLSQSNVSIAGGYSIIGYATVRNKVLLFTTNNTNSIIYVMTVVNGVYTSFASLYNDSSSPDGSTFDFSTSYPIKALGRYETEDIQKVYWTDGLNNLRFMNIADTNVQTYSTTRFEIIPPITKSSFTIDSIGNGNLKAGKVQYAYQLYNLNGAESAFVKMADFVALSNTPVTGNDSQFTGTKGGEMAGKSVTFSLSGLDTDFSRIRIARLQYFSLNELPIINIIEEATLTASMSFVDNGVKNLGELTVEEFNFINYDFICEDLESKNNILFVSDITENIFDAEFDARAFRFSSSGSTGTITGARAVLYTGSIAGSYNSYTGAQVIAGAVPATHDAICAYNALSLDGSRTSTTPGNVNLYYYRYQADGTKVGGEGPNVKYEFTYTSDVLADSFSTMVTESSYANATDNQFVFHHQHGEIYSYGLQLENLKGQYSYVKWIGDIRTPDINISNPLTTSGSNLYARNCKIKFTVNTANFPAGCVGYRIVRCERRAEDRTLLAQGLISSTRIFAGATTFRTSTPQIVTMRQMKSPTPAIPGGGFGPTAYDPINLDNTVLQLYSPDISFGNNIEYSSSDRLDLITALPFSHNYYAVDANSNQTFSVGNSAANLNYYPILANTYLSVKLTGASVEYPLTSLTKAVSDSEIVETDPSTGTDSISPSAVTIGTEQFENYCRPFGVENIQGKSTRCMVIKIPTAFSLILLNADTTYTYGNRLLVCNYRRDLIPYGGNTYTSRFSREYIPLTSSIPVATTDITVEGDSFISYFELQRTTTVLDGEASINPEENLIEVIKFPVETSINTRWRSSSTFAQGCPGNIMTNNGIINIQEKSGVHVNGGYKYTQDNGLYEYDTVYSRQNNLIKSVPKPFDITDNKTFDCRVMASDQKFNGEESDSWTKFRVNNFIDVDSAYGSINNLSSYNNELYFWQDKGFGHLSVNQRSLLQDNNPGALVVGTGGILDRYDYISTTSGNISKFGIVKTNNGMYWLDSINGIIYRFSNQLEPLSKVKGLQSYLNSKVTKSTTAIGGYDIKYNDVFITLSGDIQTIVFNEIMDSFNPFQSFVPTRYFQAYDGTISSTPNNTAVYLHNAGPKSYFYTTLYESSIKFIVNDNYDYTKVFDSIQYKTKTLDTNGVLLYNETFNTLSIYNDKQYTGEVSIVTDDTSSDWNTTKREGNFSTTIPRNIVNADITSDIDIFDPLNQDANRLYRERIRDKYVVIELTYNNTDGYSLSIPYIKTNYRISYR